ncbi:GNAT family N-acetyltransferase [Azospirillum sp. SYSU D00513]|uniref:GNAT family N-acetyltransferase n=1 Tax=Azospirillum sp. SYSU D00513 TaxID=2812561 RepID=UPI001A963DFD|nr:GNAT family N-acetyltransferase [Azospirillum sp. SYSU D00513]
MNGLTVRPATAEDVPFCLGLAPRLAGMARLRGRERTEVDAFQERFMRAALGPLAEGRTAEGASTLVAVGETGERLGFLHVEPAPDPISGDPAGYVSLLAVSEAAEGRGTARALMAAAEEVAAASGWRFLSLDVFANNGRARAFYEGQGFEPESLRLYRPVGGWPDSPPDPR